MRISEAFNAYRSDVIVFQNQSYKTEENHNVCLRALLVFFGDVEIESLTFPMIRSWKEELDKCRSSETVRNYIIKLRVVLGYCARNNVPCLRPEQIALPKRVDKVPIYLTKEQVAQLIASTKRIKNKCIISFLYASGLRVSELCSLDRGQIHEDSFTVVGKGGHARLCFLDTRTLELLEAYLRTRDDNNQALFLSDKGTRITAGTIQETFKSVRKTSGIDCHPHSLRHSFATNLLTTNTNLYHVKTMLGHKRLDTTAQYLHVVNHDLKKIYQKHHTT